MKRSARTLTLAVAGLVTVGGMVVMPGSASAQESGPAPITIDAEQVRVLCEQRVPRLSGRIERALEREAAAADVVGSTAWLREKVADATAGGRDRLALRLQRRLDARPQLTERLEDLRERVTEFDRQHCGYLGER